MRHMERAATAASFRTWRGLRPVALRKTQLSTPPAKRLMLCGPGGGKRPAYRLLLKNGFFFGYFLFLQKESKWRRERDSNPRYRKAAQLISSQPPSTTRASLRHVVGWRGLKTRLSDYVLKNWFFLSFGARTASNPLCLLKPVSLCLLSLSLKRK